MAAKPSIAQVIQVSGGYSSRPWVPTEQMTISDLDGAPRTFMALRRQDKGLAEFCGYDSKKSPELFDFVSHHRNNGVDKHFEVTHAHEIDPFADSVTSSDVASQVSSEDGPVQPKRKRQRTPDMIASLPAYIDITIGPFGAPPDEISAFSVNVLTTPTRRAVVWIEITETALKMLTMLATADMPRNGEWKRWMRTEEGKVGHIDASTYPDVKWMRNKQAAYVRLRKRGHTVKQNIFRTVKSDCDEKFAEKLDAAAKILQKIFHEEEAGEVPESGPKTLEWEADDNQGDDDGEDDDDDDEAGRKDNDRGDEPAAIVSSPATLQTMSEVG